MNIIKNLIIKIIILQKYLIVKILKENKKENFKELLVNQHEP